MLFGIRKKARPAPVVSYQNDALGLTIQITDVYLQWDGSLSLHYEYTAINDSDYDVDFVLTDVAVNGWEGYFGFRDSVPAHRKVKGEKIAQKMEKSMDLDCLSEDSEGNVLEFTLWIECDGQILLEPCEVLHLRFLTGD